MASPLCILHPTLVFRTPRTLRGAHALWVFREAPFLWTPSPQTDPHGHTAGNLPLELSPAQCGLRLCRIFLWAAADGRWGSWHYFAISDTATGRILPHASWSTGNSRTYRCLFGMTERRQISLRDALFTLAPGIDTGFFNFITGFDPARRFHFLLKEPGETLCCSWLIPQGWLQNARERVLCIILLFIT